jgi:hypothetical protein
MQISVRVEEACSGFVLDNIGYKIIDLIISRTLCGKDIKGRSFAPYSEDYKKRKIKEGYYTGCVNLWRKGTMLSAMKFQKTGECSGNVIITGQHYSDQSSSALVKAHQFGNYHLPARPFFGWEDGSMEDNELRRIAGCIIRQSF